MMKAEENVENEGKECQRSEIPGKIGSCYTQMSKYQLSFVKS